MTLTNSNLFSDSYNQIKNFINTNITDPKSRFKKQWIHPTLPNLIDQSFDGYPFIVVAIDFGEENKSMDRSTSNKVARGILGVYSDQASEVDQISDEIVSKFKNETLTDSLKDFKSIELDRSPFDFDIIGGKKISRRLITFIARKRI